MLYFLAVLILGKDVYSLNLTGAKAIAVELQSALVVIGGEGYPLVDGESAESC